MSKIVAFAGRCRSGKSELAHVCEAYGYELVCFATPLKKLCSSILEISLDELNKLKNEGTEINLALTDDICHKLSEECGIPLENVNEICKEKTILNVRDMLQFIGTDLIRKHSPSWHVDRTRAYILSKPNQNFVIDDVRFKNEKAMIDELKGDCWYITRPTLKNVSNHESETSISWLDCFDKIIVNDSTLSYLLFRWDSFMRNYDNSLKLRNIEIDHIMKHGFSTERYSMTMRDMLMIPQDMFTYNNENFNSEEILFMNEMMDGCIMVNYKDGHSRVFTNSLVIEDLKLLI